MSSLANKRILLGVTGGIAAYKCAELTRLLTGAGAEVRVAMTRAATEFVTPLTMQALSGNRVHLELLDAEAEAAMGHIELARWADLVLVAPATADFIARMAAGRADELLSALALATPAPVAVAPAMNQGMWRDAGTQANLKALAGRGATVIGPGEGEQACGDVGPGRLEEPALIVERCEALFETGLLAGVRLLLTGGPTREPLDPVRFLANRSSGKMAWALAEEAAAAGAAVTLVSGPVHLAGPDRAERVDVETAAEMRDAVMARIARADAFVAAAAVSDYRPARAAADKMKKGAERMTLELVRNPDIVAEVARLRPRPLVAGFAAETRDAIENARAKREAKGMDLIFANSVPDAFDSDEAAVTAVSADGETELPPGSKRAVARRMLELVAGHLARRRGEAAA